MHYTIKMNEYTTEVRKYIAEHHYTQSAPLLAEYCFHLLDGDCRLGVAIFGFPTRIQSQKLHPNDLELLRFYVEDGTVPNTESFFLASCLRQIKKIEDKVTGVITYADPTEGHRGTIYKASNFTLIGMTEPSFHYLDTEGHRFHKKSIWQKAKKARIPIKEYAQFLNLKRIEEKPKLKFRFKIKDETTFPIFGWVYKVTNKITNKAYVGQTIRKVSYRYAQHLSDSRRGSALPFHAAIRKYEPKNFSLEIVGTAYSRLELNNLESTLTQKYDCYVPRGYNLRVEEYEGWTIPDDVIYQIFELVSRGISYIEITEKLGISKTLIHESIKGIRKPELKESWEKVHGDIRPDIRIKITDENLLECFKLRATQMGVDEIAKKFNLNTQWLNCVFTGLYRPKLLEKWKKEGGSGFSFGRENTIKAAIKKISRKLITAEGKEFASIKEAAEFLKISDSAICKGIRINKPVKGVLFCYLDGEVRKPEERACQSKKVLVDGREFESVKAVAAYFNVTCNTVSRVLTKKTDRLKLLGKYVIEYANG